VLFAPQDFQVQPAHLRGRQHPGVVQAVEDGDEEAVLVARRPRGGCAAREPPSSS
jgi:hypothetical protein